MAKIEKQIGILLNGGPRAEICEKLLENVVFFCMLSCQNTVNTSVYTVFFTHSQKTM